MDDVSELLFQYFHPSYRNNILKMNFEKIENLENSNFNSGRSNEVLNAF